MINSNNGRLPERKSHHSWPPMIIITNNDNNGIIIINKKTDKNWHTGYSSPGESSHQFWFSTPFCFPGRS